DVLEPPVIVIEPPDNAAPDTNPNWSRAMTGTPRASNRAVGARLTAPVLEDRTIHPAAAFSVPLTLTTPVAARPILPPISVCTSAPTPTVTELPTNDSPAG